MVTATSGGQTVAPPARLGRWRGHQLDARTNSLNLIRLVLALAVLYHHAFPLGGFPGHPSIAGVQLGGWAVFAFFCLSGYLITGSRLSKPLGTYLVLRIARIYPAFWVCLLVTVVVFAPIEYLRIHETLDGYLTTGPVTPLEYVRGNASLQITSYGIGDTLATTPYPSAWNGSLWTLYHEFACYVLLGALGGLSWWRRSAWPVAVLFGLSVAAQANAEQVLPYFAAAPDLRNLLSLLPFFLGGSLVHMLRERLPLRGPAAFLCLGAVGAAAALVPVWGLHLAAPLLTYALLWAGSVVPSPALLHRHDVSYGLYIYAFPVQQLLASLGLNRHGVVLSVLLAIAVSLTLATASWLLVERPVMRLARGAGQAPDRPAVQPTAAPPAATRPAASATGAAPR